MTNNIHPSAVIEDGAVLGDGIEIGPFCHIGNNVKLADRVKFHSHVVVSGTTNIGAGTKIFPFASIGHEPQDLKYHGEDCELIVGDNCIIREGVTMNPGTAGDKGITRIGNNCVFLANSHVAHDCVVGNNAIFSHGAGIAGHCVIGENVILGGGAGVHQFCRIGRNAFIGGMTGIENDVIPFGMALGNRAYLRGLNLVGMKRAGIERQSIHSAQVLFRDLFFGDQTVREAALAAKSNLRGDEVCTSILEFIADGGDRALCTPKKD
jgi:UDP-N-acetylglucosamine acyltransferase